MCPAWLKCHEPATFCAALLNAQPKGFYAPAQLVADARRAGVEVRPVGVNCNDWDCMIESRNVLRLGMRMIRAMPEAEAASAVSGRRQGQYAKVDDL